MPRRDSYEDVSPYSTLAHRDKDWKGIIDSFRGEHLFLSNFHNEEFDCGGRIVETAEHAFQAQKTTDKIWRQQIIAADGPRHAKYLGRQAPMRPDWEQVKVGIMRDILRYKFPSADDGHPLCDLSLRLLSTNGYHLIEGNHWGDVFWGCTHPTPGSNLWVGANTLGILLMERRAQLQREIPY